MTISSRKSPTVQRRRLGMELRHLREAAGLSIGEVTTRLEWAVGKISKLEKAHALLPRVTDVRLLLDLYGVTDPGRREELEALTRSARQRGWWTPYKSSLRTNAYLEFEAGATTIHTYQPFCIPGLLQTPSYAAATFRGSLIRDAAKIEEAVRLGVERQALLGHDEPPYLWAVIDEAALLRPFGSVDDRRDQVRRLIDTESLDHVTIQVLPMDAGLHAGMAGPFVVLDFREEYPTIAYVEVPPDGLYLEEPDEVQRISLRFQHLSATALGPDASIAYLQKLACDL